MEFFCGSLVLFSMSLLALVVGGAIPNLAKEPLREFLILGIFVPFNVAFAGVAYLMYWFNSSYRQVITISEDQLSWRWGGRFFRASGSVSREGAIVFPRRTGFLDFYRSADWNVFGGGNWEVLLREPRDPAHVVAWGLSRSDAFRVVEMISECGIAKGDPDAM